MKNRVVEYWSDEDWNAGMMEYWNGGNSESIHSLTAAV
jgi:hypothetical protein